MLAALRGHRESGAFDFSCSLTQVLSLVISHGALQRPALKLKALPPDISNAARVERRCPTNLQEIYWVTKKLFRVDIELDRLEDAYDEPEEGTEQLDGPQVFLSDGHNE